ncbi:hypothetical protein V12B01_12845 [Vibrio splendidus 12B01]|nr:hypothetical protein V12B01_12845 [Vibrio splendidus 12B01]
MILMIHLIPLVYLLSTTSFRINNWSLY